jgi:hypothetical protein
MWHDAFITTHVNAYHIGTTIQNRLKSGNPVKTIIINLVREQCDNKIYTGLEMLKDGLITSQKFNGETIIFNSPHVIVFANFPPETKKLSEDRWDIRTFNDEGKEIKERFFKPDLTKKIEIPEGYSRPGRYTKIEIKDWDNFSSVSNPRGIGNLSDFSC